MAGKSPNQPTITQYTGFSLEEVLRDVASNTAKRCAANHNHNNMNTAPKTPSLNPQLSQANLYNNSPSIVDSANQRQRINPLYTVPVPLPPAFKHYRR